MSLEDLVADQLHNDPRISQAKKLLQETMLAHIKKLTGIKPPNPALKISYEEFLARFTELRGGNLWYPYIGSGVGNGALVELLDGSVKYDFISGIGPHFFGHNHPNLLDSSIDAALSNTTMQGNLQQNKDSIELSQLLIENSGLDHCFLSSSGAMAVENGMKLAFQKQFPANRLLAFDHAFTGRTLFLSQITDKPSYREGLPSTAQVDYVPFYDYKNPELSINNTLQALKQHLIRYPKQHALMIFELIQGEAGFYPGTTEFFSAIMDFLKEHRITILIDEVQTFGRTSSLFAFQHFKLEKYVDIVTIGKLSQVCGTLFGKDYKPKPGLLSQTFTGSTSAIKASITILKTLLKENFYGPTGKIQNIHQQFVQHLENIAKKYPNFLNGPYGIGGMIAFTPFDGDYKKVTQLSHALFEAGIISFIAGTHPTRIRFLPPIGTLKEEDLINVAKILEKTLLEQANN